MADHRDHLRVDQAVGYALRLLGIAGVVACDDLDQRAVDAAGGVDRVHRRLGAAGKLLAELGDRAGHRTGHADLDRVRRLGRAGNPEQDREAQQAGCPSVRHDSSHVPECLGNRSSGQPRAVPAPPALRRPIALTVA